MLTLRPSLRHTVSFNQADAPVSERVSEYDARSTDASISQYAVDHKYRTWRRRIMSTDLIIPFLCLSIARCPKRR